MGISRERQVFIGLGAVAIAGLMVDRMVLSPAGAAASEPPLAAAGATGPVASLAAAASARVQSSVRDSLQRAFEVHAQEQIPALLFGPDASWIEVPRVGMQTEAVSAQTALAAPTEGGVLPGLTVNPRVTLVMPTGRGGMAVIDGRTMRIGEVHPDGYTLVGVDTRSVTIGFNGATARLSLP